MAREYYGCAIQNNDRKSKHLPIYSILSTENNFSIDSIPRWKQSHKFNNLFIILNGQQTGPFAGEQSSRDYGKSLVGICIEKYGKYRIQKGESLASELYEMGKEDSLVLNVIDTRYNWQNGTLSNNIPLNYTISLIQNILGEDRPKIWMVGFSRGAAFGLRLIESLKDKIDVDYMFSVDPVIRDERVEAYAKKKNGEWKISLPAGFSFSLNHTCKFPILPNPNIKTQVFNIFQRKAFFWNRLKTMDWMQVPIGVAISGAYSYSGDNRVVSQMAENAHNHLDLRDDMAGVILGMIKSAMRMNMGKSE